MEAGGAFGGVKAGSMVDPMAYLRKPSVVFRIGALVSGNISILVSVQKQTSNKCATNM